MIEHWGEEKGHPASNKQNGIQLCSGGARMQKVPIYCLAFGLVALFQTLSTTGAGAAPMPVVRIATTPTDIAAQLFYAQDLGLFKKAGLDVTITVVSRGAAVSSAVMGDTFDIGQSNIPTLASAHERGIPFVIVAPAGLYTDKAPTGVCAVATNSPIKGAKDLVGKTFGVTGLFDIAQVGADAWLLQNGVDPSSVKYVEIPLPDMALALDARRIDAAVLVDPFLQRAIDAGQARVLAKCFDAISPKFLIGAFFSTADYAKAHPDIVSKFGGVMAEAARWANSHQSESAKILEAWTKVRVLPGMTRAVYADRLTAAEVQPLIDAAARARAIKTSFPAVDLFAAGVGEP
jgi:NitT/TauT family transport system substrate-binding protein